MNHNNQQIRHVLALECGTWKKTFFLDKNTYSLGRNSTSSLFCYHRVVSRNHASLLKLNYHNLTQKKEFKNIFWLIDGDLTGKKSTNGIYVNGKKCLDAHRLAPGDIIFFGGIDVKAKYDILDLDNHGFYSSSFEDTSEIVKLKNFTQNLEQNSLFILDSQKLEHFELIGETVLIVDATTGQIIKANTNAEALLGYSVAELEQLKVDDFDLSEHNIIVDELESVRNYNVSSTRESIYQRKDQQLINVLLKSMSVKYQQQQYIFIAIQNINNAKKLEDVLRYQNNHDLLTNLGNKQLFKKKVAYCLGYNSIKETQLALIKIRLHSSKSLAENIDTNKSKALENKIIEYIKSKISTMDTIAKFVENEYYMMIEEVKNTAKIEVLLKDILNFLKNPIVINDESFLFSANMGITIHPQDGQDIDELIQKSSLALEASYQKSLNNYQYYDYQISDYYSQQYRQEQLLIESIKKSKINIIYKPVIDTQNEQIIRLNCELNYSEDELDNFSQLDILKHTQKTGYTIDLIELCLNKITIDLHSWQEKNVTLKQVSLPILLSTLVDNNSFNSVMVLLTDFQTKNIDLALDIIIDDQYYGNQKNRSAEVGTARSSLSNLHKIDHDLTLSNFSYQQGIELLNSTDKFTSIKIVLPSELDLENEPKQQALIMSLLSFTNALNINFIIGGLSTQKQKDILMELGCTMMEGSIFTPPLVAEDVATFLVS